MVFFSAVVFAISSLALGYDQGIMSIAKVRIQTDLGMSELRVDVLVGFLGIFAAIGGLLSGWTSEILGRRWSLLMAAMFEIAGAVCMALAEDFILLAIGRVLIGLGVGSALMIAPLYAAELAPMRLRGALVTMMEISINVGILLGYVVGFALADLPLENGWRWMLGIGAALPIVLVVLTIFMPESPRWLVEHGETGLAEAVLAQTCAPEEADQVMTSLQQDRVLGFRGAWSDVLCPQQKWRRLIWAGMGTALFQQLSGVEAAVYYTPEVLKAAGLDNEDDQFLANVGVGLIRVLFVIVALLVVDKRVGRRKMLLGSAAVMTVAQLMIGLNFRVWRIPGLAVAGQCLFMAGYSLGFGPIGWVLVSEIFPLQIRGLAVGIATFINRMTAGLIALFFMSLNKSVVGNAGTFWMFGGFCLVSFIFTYYVVPETKGKSLEELENDLARDPKMPICCASRLKRRYRPTPGPLSASSPLKGVKGSPT